MFNPLAPWTGKALEGFLREGKRYFVRQRFDRAKNVLDQDTKVCLLLSHYESYPQAKEHFDALQDDMHRFLYDAEIPEHLHRLQKAAEPPEGYKVFTNTFMPDWERHITRRIRQKIMAYIDGKGWKPVRNETVLIDFYPHFGEVMLTLRFREQKLSIKLAEIENLR